MIENMKMRSRRRIGGLLYEGDSDISSLSDDGTCNDENGDQNGFIQRENHARDNAHKYLSVLQQYQYWSDAKSDDPHSGHSDIGGPECVIERDKNDELSL